MVQIYDPTLSQCNRIKHILRVDNVLKLGNRVIFSRVSGKVLSVWIELKSVLSCNLNSLAAHLMVLQFDEAHDRTFDVFQIFLFQTICEETMDGKIGWYWCFDDIWFIDRDFRWIIQTIVTKSFFQFHSLYFMGWATKYPVISIAKVKF